jgi:FG-GAP repeat/FG-GAP-like repeat
MFRLTLCASLLVMLVASCDFPRTPYQGQPASPDDSPADGASPDGPPKGPSGPALLFPATNAYTGVVAQGTITRFAWKAGRSDPRGLTYHLDISPDRTFTIATQSYTTTTTEQSIDLNPAFGNSAPPVGRRLYWRVNECLGTDCSPYTTRVLNFSRSDRDFNGDGYADLLIGAPYGTTGVAQVFFGAGSGIDTISDGTLTRVGSSGDTFGISVASASDFNGDGYCDVLVGASLAGAGGGAYVYLGGAGATFDTMADWTSLGSASAQLGHSVSSAGDVNGDGFSDLIVGAFSSGAGGGNAGQAFVFLGGTSPDNVADATITGAAGDRMGIAVAGVGDVNNDGMDDILVAGIVQGTPGAAYLRYGNRSSVLSVDGVTLRGANNDDAFGQSLAGAGDLNGDGYADFIVGAPGRDPAGSAYVFLGATALAPAMYVLNGTTAGDSFGFAVSAAGDVNGDGFADVIVGASNNDDGGANAGSAYVYFGGASFDTTPDGKVVGASSESFGTSVGRAGDVDGDRFPDIIVGTDAPTQGRAYVYRGGAGTQLNPVVDYIFTGTVAGNGFGVSVASARPRPSPPPRGFAQCAAKKT